MTAVMWSEWASWIVVHVLLLIAIVVLVELVLLLHTTRARIRLEHPELELQRRPELHHGEAELMIERGARRSEGMPR